MGVPVKYLNRGFWPSALATAHRKGRNCLKIISLLALALLLPACSAVRIAYNQSPELAYWYLDAYADFTGAQSLQVKAELARLQTWHRQTQLPAYITLLQDMQRHAPSDISQAQACVFLTDVRRKLTAISERAEPAIATVAASLDAGQLQHMERRFAKGNTEYREDFLEGTPKAIRARRLEQTVSRAESLYGRLDDQQVALLQRLLDQAVFDPSRSYAERLRRQRDTLQTLAQLLALRAGSAPAEKTASAIRELMERNTNKSPDTAYRDYAGKLVTDGCRIFAELHNSTSAQQRNKAIQTLNGYENDLKALVAQNGG
jgi:hypothetical protein